MEWFLLLAGLLCAVAQNTDVYQYANDEGKMEYLVENAFLPINGSFEFSGLTKSKKHRFTLIEVKDSQGQKVTQCHFNNLENRPWHFMNWTLNGTLLHCQADDIFHYVAWFEVKPKTLSIRFDAKEMNERPHCITNMTLNGHFITGCAENNLKGLTTTGAACGCNRTMTKTPTQKDKTATYHYGNKGKVEYLVENASLPINGSFEFSGSFASTLQPLTVISVEDSKGNLLAECSFDELMSDRSWHFVNWTFNGSVLQCQADEHFQYINWLPDVTEKTLSIRFDAKKTDQRPTCIRNMTIDGYFVTGCSKNTLKKFTSTAAICGCAATPTTPSPQQEENNLEIYHFEGQGKMEYLVENASLPISGRYEFFGSSKPKGWLYVIRLETQKGERLADCSFYELMDNKWHSVNWTITHDMLHCQTDRAGEYSKEWFDLGWMETKTVVIRFDAKEADERPSCIRNMTINNYPVSGCSKNTLKRFTSTAAVCGCAGFQSPTKPIKDPKPKEDKKTVYHFSKAKKTKVEWTFDTKDLPLPVSGSYEYKSAPLSTFYSNMTYNLAIYNKDTDENLAICASNQQSDGKNWLKFGWILHNDSIYCDYGTNFNSFTINWIKQKNLKRFSLRFDTDSPPTAIRKITLNKKLPITGCPAEASDVVGTVTLSGLQCEGGKLPEEEKPPQKDEKDTVYHLKKDKKVEWKVDRKIMKFPITGSFEYQPVPLVFDSIVRRNKEGIEIWPNLTYTIALYDLETKKELTTCDSYSYPKGNKKWLKFHWILDKDTLFCGYTKRTSYTMTWDHTDKYYRYSLRFDTDGTPTAIRKFELNGETFTGCPPVIPPSIQNFTTDGLQCDEPATPSITTKSPGKLTENTTKESVDTVYRISPSKKDKVEWIVDKKTTKFPVTGSFQYQPAPLSLTLSPNNGIFTFPNTTYTLTVYDVDTGSHVASCNSAIVPEDGEKWLYFLWYLDKSQLICEYDDGRSGFVLNEGSRDWKFSLRFDTVSSPTAIRKFVINDESITGCPPVVPAAIENFTTDGFRCDKNSEPKDEQTIAYHFSTGIFDEVEWYIDHTIPKSPPVSGSYDYINAPSNPIYKNHTYNLQVYDADTNMLLANCTNNRTTDGKKWLHFGWVLFDNMVLCCYEKCQIPENMLTFNSQRFYLRLNRANPPVAVKNLVLNETYTVTGCPPVVPPEVSTFNATGLLCEGPATTTVISSIGKTSSAPATTTLAVNGPFVKNPTAYGYSSEEGAKVEWIVDSSLIKLPVSGRYEYKNAYIDSVYGNLTITLDVYDANTGDLVINCSTTKRFPGKKWPYFGFNLYKDMIWCCYESGCEITEFKTSTKTPKFSVRFDTERSPAVVKNLILYTTPDTMEFYNYTITGCPAVIPPGVQNFTASGLLCGVELPKTTKAPVATTTEVDDPSESSNIYQFSTEKNAKVEWKVDSVKDLPVSGFYDYQIAPTDPIYGNLTINLNVYDADTGDFVINCNSTKRSTDKKWLYFGFTLYEDKIFCNYNGNKEIYFETKKRSPKFYLRMDTERPPAVIKDPIINTHEKIPETNGRATINHLITDCPPVVTSPVENFIFSGLLCDGEAPKTTKATTATPSMPQQPSENQIVYQFSTEKNSKAEWMVDSSAASFPVVGFYEYQIDPVYGTSTVNLNVYDVETGDLLTGCGTNKTFSGKKWPVFMFMLFSDQIYCCYNSGCDVNTFTTSWKSPKFSVRLHSERSPAAIRNLTIGIELNTKDYTNFTITGCPPVLPPGVHNFTTSGLLCGQEGSKTTKAPGGKTTKPGKVPPKEENSPVYRFSNNGIVEWKLNLPVQTISMGIYEYLPAIPDANYNNETSNLVVYDTNTGQKLAACFKDEKPLKGRKWIVFAWLITEQELWCIYSSGEMIVKLNPNDNTTLKTNISLRLDIGPRPTAIRNLTFDDAIKVTGCPPVITESFRDITISGLVCDERNSEIPSNTMQPPLITKRPIPNVEELPSQEEFEREEDDRFFQQFAPIAGAALTIGQGLISLFG